MHEEREVKIDDVLNYLKEPRLRSEIMKKFSLNNQRSFRLLRWLEKGKYIIGFYAKIEGKVGRTGKFFIAK